MSTTPLHNKRSKKRAPQEYSKASANPPSENQLDDLQEDQDIPNNKISDLQDEPEADQEPGKEDEQQPQMTPMSDEDEDMRPNLEEETVSTLSNPTQIIMSEEEDQGEYKLENKVLKRFKPLREDELVECGYLSDDQFERLRLAEGSCLILHTLVLFFSIIYVSTKTAIQIRLCLNSD